MLRKSFRLSIRRVAAYVQNGQPLDLSPAQDAAEAVANREEEMIYSGQPAFGLAGMLTAEGRQQVGATDWTAPDHAAASGRLRAAALDRDMSGRGQHLSGRDTPANRTSDDRARRTGTSPACGR